jgi:hypothetical protein
MENKKILLPNKKYIGSPDKDIQIKLNLENDSKNSIEGLYNYTVSSGEQFVAERQDSDLFRTYLKVGGMYYSNALNSPFINNYFKNYNTNYYINKPGLNNQNIPINFIAGTSGLLGYNNLTPNPLGFVGVLTFDTIIKNSTPPGYNTLGWYFQIQGNGDYFFNVNLNLDVKNIDTSVHNFNVKIIFVKDVLGTQTKISSKDIYNGNINGGQIIPYRNYLVTTSGLTLNSGDNIFAFIEDTSGNYINLQYNLLSGSTFFNSIQNKSYDSPLSNIDLLYDPVKVVTNTNVINELDPNKPYKTKSAIFSLTAPYDDIIVTNISPLTTISSEQTVELLDYWYLPTDIKRDGSYTTTNYINPANDPIIVSASTGWINIGKFLTGTTEVDFTQSNALRTNLYTFRGNMNIKIPKYQTYSFFVTAKTGDNGLLKTSYARDSVAGFMGLPDSMSSGDIKTIKAYQQYCWLNIWPDSYELSATTTPNVSYRDYYGWTNISAADIYTFQPNTVISADTNTYAFKGLVNYKLVQREPYQYRTQKLLSYDDYFDSVVPSKQYLEYLNNDTENWDLFSMYSNDKDNTIPLYIIESGLTNTFTIGDGIPAKYNRGLTLFEISATTNTVFNSYFNHNLKIGDYVSVKQISGVTSTNLGVFPVVGVGSKNNGVSDKLFTIKLSGFTGTYIQFKRYLTPTDSGSLSQYYIRKYKIIENSDNYTLTTPLSKNGFGNNNYYLTNTSEIDVSGLYDENGVPITGISYFFKKKNTTSTTTQKITKLKNKFYDEYYGARNGFISRELYMNNTNFFLSGSSYHNTASYGLGLMASGLTNTYRNGSITPDGTYLQDDTFVFDTDTELGIGTYIDFTDSYPTYSGMTGLTRSIVYRKGDDFNYNSNRYFSLFSEYSKKPIGDTSGNTFSLLGIKPTLTNYGSSQIAGSSLYPGNSMVLINNQLSDFPIGGTVYFATGSTDTLTSSTILGYELGGLYAVISATTYSNLPTTGYTNLYTLQYYGDSYNVKLSDLMFEHFVVYYLGDFETKLSIVNSINIGDSVYGDIVEYNERELQTYVLQMPNYLFKLKDLYGYTGSTTFTATTSTYAKTDLLNPVILKYLTNTIYSTNNVEDKQSWAVFNDKLNIWQWRDLIPNGDIDESGKGTNFPFLNGKHYVYNNFILPFRSKYWNPITGNRRSLSYNTNYNYNNSLGTLQTINDIDIC